MNSTDIEHGRRPFVPFIILVITVSFIFIWQFNQKKGAGVVSENTASSEFPKEGYLAPDFTLPELNKGSVTLSDYRGKIVFINFWATWCPTCDEEMASMEKLYQQFKDKDFEMLTINIDKERDIVEQYLKKNNLTFPVLLDPKNVTGKHYQTTGVPETFILDKSGVIVSKVIGPRDWSTEQAIRVFANLIEG